jgi:HK97 family phage major capsid protein
MPRITEVSDRLFNEGQGGGAPAPIYAGAGGDPRDARSPGEMLVSSEALRIWGAKYPSGGPSRGEALSDSIELRIPIAELLAPPTRARDIVSSANAGALVGPDFRNVLDVGGTRPLRVLDLVSHIQTASDVVEYAVEISRTPAATPVEEATTLTGSLGLKPEGAITWEPRSANVKTIAVWLATSRRVISDAPQLRGLVDSYLAGDVRLELEDQVLSGDNIGEDFEGILNVANTQTADQSDTVGGSGNALDILRAAKRKVRVGGRTNATAVVVNPEDAELIDTLKASTAGVYLGANPYAFGAGNQTVWGVPVIESEGVEPGVAIMADWSRSVLFDRQSVQMQIGTVGDDFIRNIVRILAELRAAFAVLRPAAFCIVTF